MQNTQATPLLISTDNDIKSDITFVTKQSESFINNNNNRYSRYIKSISSYTPPPTHNNNNNNNSSNTSHHSIISMNSYNNNNNRSRMSSSFINNHLSSQEQISIDGDDDDDMDPNINIHRLELSPQHFRDLSINFYPGFAERNAFLGHFKSIRRRRKKNKKKQSDSTPLYNNEHKSNADDVIRKDTEDAFENTLRSLSNIPGLVYDYFFCYP